jgi:hypothetical protein
MDKATPQPLYLRERDPVPTVLVTKQAPARFWTSAENLALIGIRYMEQAFTECILFTRVYQ